MISAAASGFGSGRSSLSKRSVRTSFGSNSVISTAPSGRSTCSPQGDVWMTNARIGRSHIEWELALPTESGDERNGTQPQFLVIGDGPEQRDQQRRRSHVQWRIAA